MNAPAAQPLQLTHDHAETHAQNTQALFQLMTGMWASQAIGALARLRVFDAIAKGHDTVGGLASALKLDTDALRRTLRAAKMLGVVSEDGAKHFSLTSLGSMLCSDTPGSMRALFDTETAPGHWLAWGRLDECLRRGTSVAGEALGAANIWDHFRKNPEEGKTFSEGMSSMSAAAIGAIGAAWNPPSTSHHVVDVGGAHGAFLSWVLSQLPSAKGQLYDLPHVIETAREEWSHSPIAARVQFVPGDFFSNVPAGGDLYLLKHIIHDWDDAGARTILDNVRRSMAPNGTVVIVEMLIPDDGTPSPAILLDLNMLVMLPGRERTLSEMKDLCSSAGLAVTRVVNTPSPFSLIEARLA